MTPIKTILVPVDFSPQSAAAVDFAIDLAPRYGASIELLYVYELLGNALPEHYALISPDQEAQVIGRFRQQLDSERERAEAAGVGSLEATLLMGSAREQIVSHAIDKKHDLIVMGTHGRTGLSHLLLGSVAESVLRRSPCPVATVRGPK